MPPWSCVWCQRKGSQAPGEGLALMHAVMTKWAQAAVVMNRGPQEGFFCSLQRPLKPLSSGGLERSKTESNQSGVITGGAWGGSSNMDHGGK